MSALDQEMEEPTSSTEVVSSTVPADEAAPAEADADDGTVKKEKEADARPPAKRRLSGAAAAVIEISDTESDDSDICAVTSYQASADEVKRIRGADYSSTASSSSDYSSDSECGEDDSVVVADKRVSKAVRAAPNPRANRMDDPKLNPTLKSEELIASLKSHWSEQKELSTEDVTLTCDPFRVFLLHDLLEDAALINNIVDDMNTLDWARKKMDLFEFHQTADLASLTWQRSIRGIYELLKTDIMNLVSSVTGLTLTSVSASCSLYGPGDHLLVHDDLLGDRRVAFILYLAPWTPQPSHHNGDDVTQVDVDSLGCGWSAHMGGLLELLDTDEQGRPRKVVRSVLPRNNTLALFQVGHNTFHQVSEVLSLELPRLSINGWFHGPDPAEPVEPPPPLPPPEDLKLHHQVVLLNEWISPAYLAPRARLQIQQQMEADSEVCLRSVLPGDRRRELLAALAQAEWEWVGPANACRYERVLPSLLSTEATEASAGDGGALSGVARLLTSTAFARLLSDCTDLTVGSYCRFEVQRWKAGDYTLLPPREHYLTPRLEATLYLGPPARGLTGGATTYVAPEDSAGALITVPPTDNALNLVYCDSGAASFTKYISRLAMKDDECFYIVTCTYKE